MTRRIPGAAATLLAAALNTAAAQTPQGNAQGQVTGQRPGSAAQQEGPKPYRDVVTAQAVTDSGVFIVHRIGEKLFYEIPHAMFGREFAMFADQRGTVRGVGYQGENVQTRVVRWDRLQNRVLLRLVSHAMAADSTRPEARGVRLSNTPPVVMSFDVAAWSPDDSNAVVEVTRLFTTDVQELGIRQSNVRVRRLDPARSVIERARSFPRNTLVQALQTFEVDSVPAAPGGRADRPTNSLTMQMAYTMLLLPDPPMMPRLCDARVGYGSVEQEDFTHGGAKVPVRCYISRWRLEPTDPNAAVSDVRTPITFYLDPAFPEQWASYVMRAVEAWQPVFEAAGFRRAIVARRAPTAQEDSEFDIDDARHTVIRWLPSVTENAYSQSIEDPRTGEILRANLGWFHNVSSLLQSWYWTQAGAVDPRAQRLPFPDSLMGDLLFYVAAHEVGHSLGLPHLMMSSAVIPVDSLRSRSFTCRHGTTYSVMDYARLNYVAQPGDGACLIPHIGEADYFHINWGYRRVPGATNPDAERRFLDSLARQQDAHPEYRYGRQNDPTDPRVISEALGDDPVRATEYGLQNIRRLVPILITATTTNPLEDYALLDDMYGDLIAQWAREMGHVAVVPGGVYRDIRFPTQAGVVYTAVPRSKQQVAVRFLLDNAFTTPTYFLDPAILRRIEPTGSVERIRVRQEALLDTLLRDARLSRLVEQAAFATDADPAYTVADLLADLRRGLFSEVTAGRNPDGYRRNIQRTFVEQMDRLINTPLTAQVTTPAFFFGPQAPRPPRPADARALARAELVDLDAQLRAAALRTTDRVTRAHYADLRARIDRVLDPR